MFWKFNLLTTSHIDTLLDKEDVTLHELMDEDDILQECKAQNRKLVTFLVLKENMEELVRLITEEPKDDMDEKLKYKYPNTACELLTSDVSLINDALAGSEELVNKLYSFLDTEDTLNPLLASFFSKVMGLLITRKSEMILEFLKAREDFVGTLLRHIGTSAIMDLLLRLLTCIESPEIRRAMIEWLNEQKIVKKLVSCITPSYDEDIHCNAAQSLCDIIRLGREQVIQQERADPDPLLASVETEDTVTELLDNMLTGDKNESVIVNGLSVIQTLLESKRQGSEDSAEQMTVTDAERMFTGVNNVLMAICPRLKEFHTILTDPPKQRFDSMPTTVGSLEPPLGNTRLQTSRLIASLLLTNTHSINVELNSLGTINVLMDLYFRYMWNNFLHTHVTQCLYTILINPSIEVEGKKENLLLGQLFTDVKLIERILEEWDINDQEQSKEGGRRKGFMGHLTRLANDIVNAQEKGENEEMIKSLINGLSDEVKEKWDTYVTGTLAETNKKNTVELIRGHNLASSSEDDDADFSNFPFPQDTAMQQAFSDYQLQQMTSNFIDQFGFSEEEFGEQEEKTDSPFSDRISSIDFGVSVNDETRPNAASMFEQSCNEKLQQFDNDSDEDIWEEKEIRFSPAAQQTKRSERLPVSRDSNDSEDSTDSDEELDSPKRITQQPSAAGEKMDIDSNEAWTANFNQGGTAEAEPVAMDTSPWDSSSQKDSQPQPSEEKWADFSNKFPEENWADFSNFSDVKDSDRAVVRSSSPVDMDTTEASASSRSNAYLADNKESDLVLESVDTSVDVKVEDSENNNKDSETHAVDKTSAPTSAPSSSTEETASSQTESHKGDAVKDEEGSTKSSSDTTVDSSPPSEPSSSPPAQPPTSPQPPAPSGGETVSTPPQSPRSPPATTDCDQSSPANSKSSDAQAQGDGCNTVGGEEQDEADDLNANFSFLSKVGLLKAGAAGTNCTQVPEANSEVADVQGNGPTNDGIETDVDNLEQIRSQAKDALDSYDTAIKAGASLQNGPV